MTSPTGNSMTSLVTTILDHEQEQLPAYENVGDVYNVAVSRQFRIAAVSQPTQTIPASRGASTVTLPALSLAADPDQLSSALARLLISPSSHHTTAPSTTMAGVRQRRRVDRSASEPLPSSSTVLEAGAFCRYKTELCRPYEENGTCKYGDKCQFAHGRAELRPVARHPKYKTDLCKTYHTTGLCPYGPRCHFIHNDDERRLNELNRIVIEQQRAMLIHRQHRHVLAQVAEVLARRRQMAAPQVVTVPVTSRSPSPLDDLQTTGSVRANYVDDAALSAESSAAVLAALVRRVQLAAPQLTDSEVQSVVTRLIKDAVLSNPSIPKVSHHHHHHLIQQQTQHLHQVAQSPFNYEERLLAL